MTSDDRGRFWKGHALGNDYIVIEGGAPPSEEALRRLCDRHRGVGADGVLLGDTGRDPVALRIFNPDGGEAEKSGNGLRIFAAWLHHRGLVTTGAFRVALPGETVEMAIQGVAPDGTCSVRVDMGTASFRAADVHFDPGEGGDPVDPVAEVPGVTLRVGDATVPVHLVSMGNPHCVVFAGESQPPFVREDLLRLGPAIQAHPGFRRGVNVQLARLSAPGTLDALVWERGAGETLASGSSACAVAAAAVRSGRAEPGTLRVRMPGGELEVHVGADWRVRLTGPAQIVYEGRVLFDAG
jgi:diaminopimelate epimerase